MPAGGQVQSVGLVLKFGSFYLKPQLSKGVQELAIADEHQRIRLLWRLPRLIVRQTPADKELHKNAINMYHNRLGYFLPETVATELSCKWPNWRIEVVFP